MHKELTTGLRQIQIIFHELIYCCQDLFIQRRRVIIAKHFLNKHLAQWNRKLIDQTSNSQFLVSNDIFICIEDLCHVQSHSRFLIRTGYLSQRSSQRSVGCTNPFFQFSLYSIGQHFCKYMAVLFSILILQTADHCYTIFFHRCDKVSVSDLRHRLQNILDIKCFALFSFY